MIEHYKHPVLFFSAGKDSLAVLHLMRGHWDQLTVVWSNPGAPHPIVREYMDKARALLPNFVELQGDQPEWVKAHGWPVDVLPIRFTHAGELGAGPAPVRFQSYMDCCWNNMWRPMDRYAHESGADLIITGQRHGEGLRNRMRDGLRTVIDGITYLNPINNWSERQVMAFLEGSGVELPPFYAEGATSSSDCWNCTAYLDHNAGRLAHMRDAEPERFAQVHAVLAQLQGALTDQGQPLANILKGA